MNPTDQPTFGRPANPRDYVPGKLIVRVQPEALRPHVASPRLPLSAKGAERVPDSVAGPLDDLRRNAGLQAVEPLFSARRAQLATRGGALAPGERHRLAVAASVADVETDERAGFAVLSLPEKQITKALVKRIAGSPAIELAERLPARWLAAGADPMVNLQWGLPAIRYFEAKRPAAKTIKVGIIDTGIDTTHPDLAKPVLYRRSGFKLADPVGHGTHVSGVIAAKTNNSVGISGISDCQIAMWKVFPDDPNDPYLDSESYLRALGEVVDEGVAVVNLSIGGGAHSQTEAALFAAAISAGVTFVAAMGNEYEEGNPTSYPAAYDDVVSVGAIAADRRRSSFSNTGPHIDVVAPGSNILSTLPMQKSQQRQQTGYAAWSGTSMATPHVTAAAALVLAKHPGWSPVQVAKRLRASASNVPAMNKKKWTEDYGDGLLNLKAALA